MGVNRGGRSGDPKRNCPSCDSLLTYLDIRGARYWLSKPGQSIEKEL